MASTLWILKLTIWSPITLTSSKRRGTNLGIKHQKNRYENWCLYFRAVKRNIQLRFGMVLNSSTTLEIFIFLVHSKCKKLFFITNSFWKLQIQYVEEFRSLGIFVLQVCSLFVPFRFELWCSLNCSSILTKVGLPFLICGGEMGFLLLVMFV